MAARILDEPTRRKLQYVRASPAGGDMRQFPDFFIIGPQRTGTTWLHANLRRHPQIFLAEPKELFFFSSLKDPGSPRFRSNELHWYVSFFRDPLWRLVLKNAFSLAWYGEFYRPRVRGEATASYAALDRDVIAEIAALNPDLKVVLMIRDPVDRAWSHAKKDLVRKRACRVEDVKAEEFERFFHDPYQRRCARYVEIHDNWSRVLQPGHVLVGLFDDIASRPDELLLRVMAFLGVACERRYLGRLLRRTVNPTGPAEIPEQYRRLLEELFAGERNELAARFGFSWR